MAVGRITGPLLKANLLRDGVDLAFETDLLYLDVTNGKVGIKRQPDPLYDLDINGATRSTNLDVTNEADIASFTISGNTISSTESTINLEPSGTDPVVYQGKIVTGDLQISSNTIEVTAVDTDLDINTLGTGKVNINSNLLINGDLHVTGTITADGGVGGTITIGDSNTDNVVFNADINSNIVPDDDATWDLGSDPATGGKAWRNIYTNEIVATTLTIEDLTVNGNLESTGNATFNSDVTFGDSSSDTVTFNGQVAGDIVPTTDSFYDLGTDALRWSNGYFSRIEVDAVVLDNNSIGNTAVDTDLTLTASGSGKISIPNNNTEFGQDLTVGGDLTVTTGTTYLQDVTVVGDIDQTGDTNQTGDFTTSGTTEVTGNVTATGTLNVGDLSIHDNVIEVTTQNADLELLPNGVGSILFENIQVENNTFRSTGTDQDITLQPQGSGSVVVQSNQSLIIPVGSDAERPASPTNGMIRYNTDRNEYEGYNATYSKWLTLSGVQDFDGNTKILAESTPGANDNVLYFYADGNLTTTIDSTKLYTTKFQTTDLDIENSTISAINTSSDINLTTTGTGRVKIGNLAIRNNTITNTSSGAVTEFVEAGSGYVKITGTNGVVIPAGDTAQYPVIAETGMVRFNTFYGYVEVYNGTSWINSAGATSGVTLAQAQDIGIVSALLFG